MGSIHLGAIALLSESEGVFTTAQAERMGVPRDALHDAVESGRLERIMRGAYRMIGSGSSYTDGLVAAWKLTAPARFAHEPAEVGDRPDRPHGGAEAWKRAMVSRFWRARTTVAHTAWTTMRMIARTTVTASAGFAEPSRAMADIMAVPAVSHGRPWFAGAARAIPPTRRRPRRPRAPATRCSCPRRGTRRPGG